MVHRYSKRTLDAYRYWVEFLLQFRRNGIIRLLDTRMHHYAQTHADAALADAAGWRGPIDHL
ncbi:hypothetical protein C4K68_03660 [Pokkaliibacter plantistimulans]|uniref:Uncharacterized protein n=1 Tax=Proteobacteria bacterium 228 TaxID=2083153 RepID=A0A2S5KWG9_9PROT|nr:hypothetical protein C4K68_03660 [Pokkaliibacter plantistimulans]